MGSPLADAQVRVYPAGHADGACHFLDRVDSIRLDERFVQASTVNAARIDLHPKPSSGLADHRSASDRGASPTPICFPPALTVGMYASPMAAMSTVVKTKSVEYMPFFLSFFLFLNGGVWSIYSVLVRDFFIGVPNAIGFAMGSAQLVLYAVYRRKKPAAKASKLEAEEEGSAHLVGRVEMKRFEESNKASQHKHLNKGSSLPKPSAVSRQLSFQKIVKSVSMTPYELHFIWDQNDHTAN
ncbi:Sugar efflux transporter for intercellular exchange [Musa troglodytarum]|uniref:Bidirectional sugar transporter SWEET n=1 Tax=Musa troglodytarum TaxID=320322 RepID=A0A9E7JU23_9LILI|nr:Sugar efflux transporter for intercellular exchange [Musa troglodytarum]